ncbi:thioredoxin family protein [Alteribacter natronophilus]|uniref:thioredoxin family protein n=1 Tax=Alteribacter natronophilus TaxID=2583810 RepID=UPI0014875D5C|nr:thioredoxin family protein [Alteribacter natronophilus]
MTFEQVTSFEQMLGRLEEHTQVIVLLKSRSCSVCEAVETQALEFSAAFPDVHFAGVQLEDVPEIRGQWTVFSAPTILFFYHGKEVWRGSRFISWDELGAAVERTLGR